MINGHGDDIHHYTHPITSNFSSNVYCGIDHQELFQRLGSKISCLCNYPEPAPVTLETAFADFFQVTGESVCVTNGATEAIYLIAQAFRGRKSAVWAPTFSEYADACRLHHHKISYIYTYDSLPADAEVVWLCNPNNPTGEVRPLSKLKDWISCNPHKLFVIDQSYEAFTLHPLYSVYEAAALPNVLLIHSLTKHFAIPGLRIGYLTGHPEILRDIRVQRMPWSVNALAIEAGFYALEQHLSLPFDLVGYLNEKEKFINAWKQIRMVDVWDSDTHFFLLRLRQGKVAALKDFLVREYGILIRDASNFRGLDESFFRLATQTPRENKMLIQAFMHWLQQ